MHAFITYTSKYTYTLLEQVGLLCGDMMETIERKFNEEKAKAKLVPVQPTKPDTRVPI